MDRKMALFLMGCCFIGFLFFAGLYGVTKNEIFAYIGIALAVGIYIANLFNCCPNCGKHVGRNSTPTYCPHCGEHL